MEKLLRFYTATFWTVIVLFGEVGASTEDQTKDRLGREYGRLNKECATRYKEITESHTRCLRPSPAAESVGGISAEDIRVIVDYHNKVRREVSPAATNMLKMTWDESLADIATRWAFNCIQQHDKGYKRYDFGRFSVGQNLAWATHNMGWGQAMSLWANEKKDFHYNGANALHAVGHYTQMVWAETSKVGCGLALCNGKTYYYVCNYGPAGNLNIKIPYKSGRSCGECPARCNDKLCDCGDRVCLNGGKMFLDTCTCTCFQSFQIEPDCGLNCTDIENTQPRQCPQYRAASCPRYSNVPQECPLMCGWCPDADYKVIAAGHSNPSSSDIIKFSMITFCFIWTLYLLVETIM